MVNPTLTTFHMYDLCCILLHDRITLGLEEKWNNYVTDEEV